MLSPHKTTVAPASDTALLFVIEIEPETYLGRERYAANNAISGRLGRPGVIARLRDIMKGASGETVVLTITTK